MTCPICGSKLYEQERKETTSETLISIRCTNLSCSFFDYKTIPVSLNGTTSVNISGTISDQKYDK